MRVSGHIRSIFLASLHLAIGQPILGETCHISIKVQLHLDGRGPTTRCPRPVQAWEGWLVVRLPPPILGPSRSYSIDISLTTTHQAKYLSCSQRIDSAFRTRRLNRRRTTTPLCSRFHTIYLAPANLKASSRLSA
jgi:hypothetical protein